jgi:hypothetical protein
MPRLIIAVLFLCVLFVVLCGPVLAVALRLRRRGDGGALRPLRMVWLLQAIVASGLIFAADAMGKAEVGNPMAWVLGIIAGVGMAGAVLFTVWRLALRTLGASRRR